MANPGDLVEIQTKEQTYSGTLIPRPELLADGIVVLKLENGYNIGIDQKKITKTTVLKPYAAQPPKQRHHTQNKSLPTVAVLSFGGTISSRIDYKTGGVAADYSADDFLDMCPELATVANIKAQKIMQIMSEDADLETIEKMAVALQPWLEDESVDGIVMTLGTDAFHYISAALSFMIQNLSKPLVLTAAQRSIDRGSSDAFMNLSCAVKAAAAWDGAEIVSCMHGSSDDSYCYLIRATKVRKMHTSRRDAFRPINILPFAKVTYPALAIEKINDSYVRREKRKLSVQPKLEKQVALIHVHPGIAPDVIDFYIQKKYKGIVLAATALGHVPTAGASNLLPALRRAIDAGLIVGIATQTIYGRVHPFVYTNLRKLSINLGCVFGEDMLPETAYMKLCWLLANKAKDVKTLYSTNCVGEINTIIDAESFLY